MQIEVNPHARTIEHVTGLFRYNYNRNSPHNIFKVKINNKP